jgi:hypothetical protein
MTSLSEHFKEAIARFDAANAADPNKEAFEGKEYPKELLYAQRMTAWLDKYQADASEVLRLATRAQHICRWRIPRSEFPMDRDGYNKWRTTLAKMHGEIAAEIMQQVGYDEKMCEQVKALLMKDRIKLAGDDGQTLEDVVCLVFLEFYFAPFAPQYSAPKLTSIVRKTWRKMSERGHQTALTLAPKLPGDLLEIVKKAIA